MSTAARLSLHPTLMPAKIDSFPKDIYSLHGKEVEVIYGFDQGRRGVVTGICFRRVSVRLHQRPNEEILLSTDMIKVIELDTEDSAPTISSSSLPSTNSAGVRTGDVYNSATASAHEDPALPDLAVPGCEQSMFTNMDIQLDFTGWTPCQIIFAHQASEGDVAVIKQAITLIVQGQLQRHSRGDSRSEIVDAVMSYSDGRQKLGFSLPDAHDTWIFDVLQSLPLVEAVLV